MILAATGLNSVSEVFSISGIINIKFLLFVINFAFSCLYSCYRKYYIHDTIAGSNCASPVPQLCLAWLPSGLRSKISIFGQKMGACPYLGMPFYFFGRLGCKFLCEPRRQISIDCWWEVQVMMHIFQIWFLWPLPARVLRKKKFSFTLILNNGFL